MTSTRKAFFDLDDTIIEGSAGKLLAEILTNFKVNTREWKEFWEKQKLLKTMPYDEAIDLLSNSFAKGVTNVEIETIDLAVSLLKEQVKVRPDFSEFYSWLISNNFEIFVLTASPVEVFKALADYEFTGTFGLLLEKKEKYTGNCTLSMTSEEKKRIIDQKARDVVFSFGVTDTIADLKSFDNLDIKFLIGGSYSTNGQFIQAENFLQIREILKKHLSANKDNHQ